MTVKLSSLKADLVREAEGDWVFSFENICETLGFNPAYLRQGLLRWVANKLPKHPKGASSWEGKKMAG